MLPKQLHMFYIIIIDIVIVAVITTVSKTH